PPRARADRRGRAARRVRRDRRRHDHLGRHRTLSGHPQRARPTPEHPARAPGPATLNEVVRGLTIPALANCHSHAFHRALRGHTQTERGTFWTWREQMYEVASRLTPDSY